MATVCRTAVISICHTSGQMLYKLGCLDAQCHQLMMVTLEWQHK